MSGDDYVLRADSLRAALSASALQSLPSETLARFVSGRRWFGAKGGAITNLRIIDVVPLDWGRDGCAITRLAVRAGDQDLEYQLPLTVVANSGAAPKATVVAVVEAGTESGVLVDATEDADFRRALGDAFERGFSAKGSASEWRVERLGDSTLGIGGVEPKLGSAEQSNTSMIFGDRAILKFFRRLEAGQNPDPEIGSALTEAGFGNVPRLLGRMTFQADGGTIDAGMLQQLVPGAMDAWKYALDTGKGYFSGTGGSEPTNAFAKDAEAIGRVTRALHDALASIRDKDAFRAQPATPADVAEWATRAKRSVTQGLDLLASVVQRKGLPDNRLPEADALLKRRQHFLEYLDEIVRDTERDGGARIRHHGDYHLGQLLRGSDGEFYVIDFEGEPARALAERREPHSALRDVAGMLRSFGYAAATLATEASAALQPHVRELQSARWERDARSAFLRGYLGTKNNAGAFLPREENAVRQLIALFETEKVFYELAYELNNRPDWVWIPMRGISKLLTAASSPSEELQRPRSRPARG